MSVWEAATRTHTYREILAQPGEWQETLARAGGFVPRLAGMCAGAPQVIFTGCGSSYFLSLAAANLFQQATGLEARAVPASEILFSPAAVFAPGRRHAVVGISRSGQTTETVAALEKAREAGADTAGFTCRAGSRFAGTVGVPVVLDWADERSTVMTGSFTTILLAIQVWAAQLAGRADLAGALAELPGVARAGMAAWEEAGRELGADPAVRQYIFLGSGPYYGLACEAMLKVKEMTQFPVEAYPPLEFRHGPISVVEPGACAVVLGLQAAARPEAALLADVAGLGGATATVAAGAANWGAQRPVELGTDLADWPRAALHLVPLHFLALSRALLLGKNPDQPRHLNYSVVLHDLD